ncbi:MAG: hypothetical protein L0H31_16320 [Nocardioidaceae bacterium]|nr:hypothetical protein [Nocardioidaceae bacterium]
MRTKRQKDDDGQVFCTVSTLRGTDTVVRREYVRKDGTTFLLDEEGEVTQRQLTLLAPDGQAVGAWARAGKFYRAWLQELSEDEPVALVVDSPYAARTVGQFEAPHQARSGGGIVHTEVGDAVESGWVGGHRLQ